MGDIVDDWSTTGVENMLKSNSIKLKLKAEPCYTLIWNVRCGMEQVRYMLVTPNNKEMDNDRRTNVMIK